MPGQAHHLINVMRIFKKRRRSRRIAVDGRNEANNKGWVRIFNGHNRKWLARVVRTVLPPCCRPGEERLLDPIGGGLREELSR